MFRPKTANYIINEKVTIDTTDREDHTFCGIAFPIQCKAILPVDHLVINSISVRGGLGELSVYISKENPLESGENPSSPSGNRENNENVPYHLRQHQRENGNGNGGSAVKMGKIIMKEKYWDKIYEQKHGPSFRAYQQLDLSANPIVLKPGEIRGVYIHSTLDNDQAIVYDNQQNIKTHDDQFITVLPGRAHVSTTVFGTRPIWGWGNAWRDNREFVGKISYGVVYKLWNPSENLSFGNNFRSLARVLFMCQRRWESPMSSLSDDCIFYILNMCRWDWMEDSVESMRNHKRNLNRQRIAETAAALAATEIETGGNGDGDDDDDDSSYGENDAEADAEIGVEEDEDEDSGGNDTNDANIPERMEIEVPDEDEYDSDFVDSDEDDGSDDDDGYEDHQGSSSFNFYYYDDCGSSGEEEAAEEMQRERAERRRLLWLRHHFVQRLEATDVNSSGDDDSE